VDSGRATADRLAAQIRDDIGEFSMQPWLTGKQWLAKDRSGSRVLARRSTL